MGMLFPFQAKSSVKTSAQQRSQYVTYLALRFATPINYSQDVSVGEQYGRDGEKDEKNQRY